MVIKLQQVENEGGRFIIDLARETAAVFMHCGINGISLM